MNQFIIPVVLFIGVPLVEIYVLIKVGGVIGALPTVLLVVLTAVIGVWLVRWQGFATLWRARKALAEGRLPALELLEGIVLLAGGLLLIVPGFVTDILGFLCLIPGVRRALVRWAMARGALRIQAHRAQSSPVDYRETRTLEGESRREDD